MSVNQRLIDFINEVGIQDILKKTNLGQSLIYKLRDSGGATANTLEEIFKGYPNLSTEWLFKGIGNKWNLEINGTVHEEASDYKRTGKAALISKEEVLEKQIELLQIEMKRLELKMELLEKEILRKK